MISKGLILCLVLLCSVHCNWADDTTLGTTPGPEATTMLPPRTTSKSTTESLDSTTDSVDSTTDSGTTDDPTKTTTSGPPATFSCKDFGGNAIDLEKLSGSWYEVGRVPDTAAMQCVHYKLPNGPTDDKVVLETEYINNSQDKWEHSIEHTTIPWNDDAKNGIIVWSLEVPRVRVTYKLIITDNPAYTLACGYIDLTPVTLFKVLSRERELNATQKNEVQKKFNELGQNANLVWVEQSEQKCSGAMRATGSALVALILALIIHLKSV